MKRSIYAILIFFIFLFDTLIGSEVKLIEANEAIRLIGNTNVVFVSADNKEDYGNEHIANSVDIYMDPHDITAEACLPLYSCPKDTQEYIQRSGIRSDQTVVVYDTCLDSNATGIYSFFESFGHKNILILNGGLRAIEALDPNQKLFNKLNAEYNVLKNQISMVKKSGEINKVEKLSSKAKGMLAKMSIIRPKLLITQDIEKKIERSNYILDGTKINLNHITDKMEVKKAIESIQKDANKSRYTIVDSRSIEEFSGKVKLKDIRRSGHIPEAKLIESKRITDFVKKKTFKSLKGMQNIFDRVGIRKDQIIYVYSNYGIGRGAHVATALRLLGYKDVRIFTGGWSSWGNDMSLPAVQ